MINNEVVAWMSPDGRFSTTEGKLFYIPLYTHPPSLVDWSYQQGYKVGKETHPTDLTDEEIYYCWSHSYGNTPWMKQKAFARAILRKAQEK